MDIGKFGLWDRTAFFESLEPEELAEIVELGLPMVWVGGSPPADLALPEKLLAASSNVTVATGIVNVWSDPPEVAARSYHRLSIYADRFLLGIGAGHSASGGVPYKPYDKLVGYLDGLDAGGVPTGARILAALGPRVLRLASDRTAGAHPYLVTPDHTATAREILGAGKLLIPEHKVILSRDPETARTLARDRLAMYLALPNYTRNWLRLGFTEDDISGGGSDRLVDAMVAWGDEETIRTRLEEHITAGADQVAVQILNDDKMVTLRRLAPALA
ncbi:MAG: LLM class F420-dependent oxidoreductase [Acidimicrobiia bacterium]